MTRELFPDNTPIADWFYDTTVPQLADMGKQYVLTDYGILADGKMLLERELEDLHNDFCKVQVAFDPETREAIQSGARPDPYAALNILWKESRGNVDLLLVKGARAAVEEDLKAAGPVILDPLPLTLEEVFIFELGGDDREISSLIF